MNVVEIDDRKAILRNCPQCNATAAHTLSNEAAKPWLLKKCQQCDFVYVHAAPVYEELLATHSWDKTAVQRQKDRKHRYPILHRISKSTRWRLHIFKRHTPVNFITQHITAGNVLDVGCGKGAQLNALPSQYTANGVEISQVEASFAMEVTKKRGGGSIIVAPAVDGLKQFPDNSMAAVIMRSYLEHEAQPKEVLIETARVLQPDGIVVIKVPNYGCFNRTVFGERWCGFRFPDHLNYFTPASLESMCTSAGLSIKRFKFLDKFPLSDNMWLIAGKA